MGKDFRIGLITGLVLGVVALVWVATRPSLTPAARMRQTLQDRGFRAEDLVREEAIDVNSQPESPNPPLGEAGPTVAASQEDASISQDSPPQSDESPSAADSGEDLRSIVEGTRRSDLPDLTVYERAEPIKTTRFHIVRRGETLSAIARQYYNAPRDWPKIVAANPGIKDANRIAPGTKLTIPE